MVSAQDSQRVTAAEFIRGFGSWRLQAARRPVVVTHHGKDAHVLISLDDYRRLDGARRAEPDGGALVPSQAALLESIRDAVLLIDRRRRILSINPAASDMAEIAAASLIGQDLSAVFPNIARSLLFPHILRMIDHRERFSGDIPGLIRPRQWVRADLIPLPVGGAIVLRDISEAMDDAATGDAHRALADAVNLAGDIGEARLSVREAIENANAALTAMVGVDAAAIRRVRFSALLSIGQRAAFAEALESVFRTGEPARIASELVTREGAALPMTLSIVERRGPYASDGALVLVTRRPDS